MKNEEEKIVNEVELSEADFEFVHNEGFGKIHDEKFKTKSTTFLKDALKRFAKNKSSVIAAGIIAVLMLGSIFVPIISPYDTTKVQDLAFRLLPPKLFNPGNKLGFWDGTISKTSSLVYDEESESYVPKEGEYTKLNAVVKGTYTVYDTVKYDYASPSFYGGYIKITSRDLAAYSGDNSFYVENFNSFKVSSDSKTLVTISMANLPAGANEELGEYRIRLGSKAHKKDDEPNKFYDLTPWTNNYPTKEEPLVLDLSAALAPGETLNNCVLRFEGKPNANKYSYFLLEQVLFECEDQEYLPTLEENNIIDPNSTALLTVDKPGCWVSTGALSGFQCEFSKVKFRYDVYEDQFGLKKDFVIGKNILDQYIANGWCTYDWDVGPSSFKRLSDKCPIIEHNGEFVTKQSITGSGDSKVYQITCNVTYYKYLGYSSMPSFLFGTDDSGRACFTHSLRCLKNSLLVSILCSIVILTIGLIWGSVSGYYGGSVDLIMERISDILAGVPSTVVLTLVLILMGRNLGTFAFAVCLTGWIGTASLTRTQMYRFKNRESVLASRTLGANDARLIFRHILPNALGTIVTSSVLMIPSFIFTEASLAFLHLGLDTGDSFGVLISNNQTYLSTRPMLTFFPAFILCLLMISFNLFGNGLRDALNPTLKGGEQ